MLQSESGEVVELEWMAVELLTYMANHAGEVISIDELMDNVWTGKIVTHSTVRRIISLVRKALKDDIKSPTYIQNIPKRGYVLIAEVKILDKNELEAKNKSTDNIPQSEKEAIKERKKPFTKTKFTPLIFFTIVIVSFFIYLWFSELNLYGTELDITPVVSSKGAEKDLDYSEDANKIIYSHKNLDEEYWHLYSFDTDNNLITQLTKGQQDDTKPRFSPDASKVAFLRKEGKKFDILVGNYSNDGRIDNTQSVYSSHLPIGNIIWNEYGDSLFFSALDERFIYSVFVLNLLDNTVTRLTLPASNSGGDYLIALSDDKDHIAVARLAGNETEIIVYRLEGFSPTYFSKVNAIVKSLSWHDNELLYLKGSSIFALSPDNDWEMSLYHESRELISQFHSVAGRVFAIQGDLSNSEIRQVANPLTSLEGDDKNFTISSPQRDFSGIYSKVSDRIYFLSHRSGLRQIWQWDKASGYEQLTNLDTYQQIDNLQASNHSELLVGTIGRQLFMLNAESTEMTYLSPENHYVTSPVWSLDGSSIFYINHYLGEYELWKADITSGNVERIDKNITSIQPYLGSNQFVAHDGKSAFFYNINNGSRSPIPHDIELQINMSWQVLNNNLYWTLSSGGGAVLNKLDLKNNRVEQSSELVTGLNHKFNIKKDESSILFNVSSSPQTDIVELK